jgi:hypothetical protein
MDTDYSVSDIDTSELNLGEVCSIHNEAYTNIYKNSMYCDKCIIELSWRDKSVSIEEWKKQTLIEMNNFEYKLNKKIKGLTCICEMIHNHREIIKQIEDIIDTAFVDISHISNFNKSINEMPISNLIKRKNKILNSNINIQIELDNNPLLMKYIKIIIKNNGDINANNDWVLRWASANGSKDVIECLLLHGVNVHADDDYALRWASNNGHLDVVKCLISHGADIHSRNDQSLTNASENGHLTVVEYLLSHGAKNKHGALIYASKNGHLDVVECLISHGADIHSWNDAALAWSSTNGHLDVVKCLIKHGEYIYAINNKTLKWASRDGHPIGTEYLKTIKLTLSIY